MNKLILPGAVETALAEQENIDERNKLPDLTNTAINPHGLTAEDLLAYQLHHRPLVLQHGRKKVGLACVILASNGAMNQLGEIGRRHSCHRSMAGAMEVLQGTFVNLFDEMCLTHKWSREEIKLLQGELVKAELKDGTPTILSASGSPLKH